MAASLFIIWMGMSVARTGQRAVRPTLRRYLQLVGGAQAALGLAAMLMGTTTDPPAYFLPFLLVLVIAVPITRHLLAAIAARDANSSTH